MLIEANFDEMSINLIVNNKFVGSFILFFVFFLLAGRCTYTTDR